MFRFTIICLFIIVCSGKDVACNKKLRQENSEAESNENTSGTLMISNLVLLPILAGVGIKFLILLPIVLSKIALLGILSFVSSNLSLLVSAIMGAKSYFFDDKPIEEDYDYDGRYKSGYDYYKQHKYLGNKDPRHHEVTYDPFDKYMHHHKGYESSHPEYYNPHYSEHKMKKQFRPFKLLERIKDVIKDHFRGKSGKSYEEKDHELSNLHDLGEDHNEYIHEMDDLNFKDSHHPIKHDELDLNSKYFVAYKVPQDWSHKEEVRTNFASKDEEHPNHQNHDTSASNGSEPIKTIA